MVCHTKIYKHINFKERIQRINILPYNFIVCITKPKNFMRTHKQLIGCIDGSGF